MQPRGLPSGPGGVSLSSLPDAALPQEFIVAKPSPKPAALSAQAKHCLQLKLSSCSYDLALTRVDRHLSHYFNLDLPKVGPAPSCESIVAELRARDERKASARAEARKRRGSRSMDNFVIYAWRQVSPATRAMLVSEDGEGPSGGDLDARLYARAVRDQFDNPSDYSSFIDELMRLS